MLSRHSLDVFGSFEARLLGPQLDWSDAVRFGLLINCEAVFVSVSFVDRCELDGLADRVHRGVKVADVGLGGGQGVEADGIVVAAEFDDGLCPLNRQVGVANFPVGASGQQPSRATLSLCRLRIEFDRAIVFGSCLGVSANVGQNISPASGGVRVGRRS